MWPLSMQLLLEGTSSLAGAIGNFKSRLRRALPSLRANVSSYGELAMSAAFFEHILLAG